MAFYKLNKFMGYNKKNTPHMTQRKKLDTSIEPS